MTDAANRPDRSWRMGGDVAEVATVIANRAGAGAILRVEAERTSDESDHGADRDEEREDELFAHAWTRATTMLRPLAGKRTGWLLFELVLEGERSDLLVDVQRLLDALVTDQALMSFTWRMVLIEVFPHESARTLMCDPGYDLAKARAPFLVWVEPYAGDDWRESQRYPTVSFYSP